MFVRYAGSNASGAVARKHDVYRCSNCGPINIRIRDESFHWSTACTHRAASLSRLPLTAIGEPSDRQAMLIAEPTGEV
jgi:hypothetical protein